MKKTLFTVIAICAAMAGCGTDPNTASDSTQDLIGKWTIVKAGDMTTDKVEQKPFINFTDSGMVNGFAAVNNFFGNYTVKEDSISFDHMGMTMMAGPDMDIETAIIKAFNDGKTVNLKGNTLQIMDASGKTLMTMERE